MLRNSLITVLLLIFQFHLKAQTLNENLVSRIDSIVGSYMTSNKMVGISIGIVKNGNVYLAKGYGTCEINTEKTVDSLTNFLMCSITKLFTSTAIMQLAEQGKIDIHQKLISYLPDFKMKDQRYKDISIEQMLTHTSGLYWDMKLKHSPNDSTALRKLVYSLGNKILDFAPGTKFDATKTYSNAAYDILGYLVQYISGKQYEDYIKENILLKTNMRYSSIDYKKISTDRRSSPHILKNGNVKIGGMISENTEHSPSANLNSCSADLCNWMIHIINIYSKQNNFAGILQKNTLTNMWTSRQIAPQNKKVSMGLGWFIKDTDDLGKYFWHVGDNPGYSSTLMIFPDNEFGITILTNGMYAEQIVWNKIPFDIINLFKNEWKK